ncbi:MAG TPA: hypothetical protein VFD01_13195 [Candidatus Dormibacteraeota bacterium]|nr:hypothetical protein [Candidatus Dormibacteraeota bacterium]
MPAVDGVLRSLVRAATGVFWLSFASQKWGGVDWMRPLIEGSAAHNPIPGLQPFLAAVVAPNWHLAALAQAAGETVAGVLLLVGLATGAAAWLGVVLGLGLSLTVAFELSDPGLRWLYYLAVLVNLAVAAGGPGTVALERIRGLPGWMAR